MSENTSPSGSGNLSAGSGFTFTVHGAVAKITDSKPRVHIPPAVREQLEGAVSFFAAPETPNNRKIDIDLPTEDLANELRAQIETYALDNGLTVTFHKFSPEHTATRTVKDTDGNPVMGADGKPQREEYTVPANKYPAYMNTGTNVTFRLVRPKVTDKPATDTKTVTVTAGTPKPAAPQSRGNKILGK